VAFFSWEALRGALVSLGIGAVVLIALGFLGFPHPVIRRGPSVEGTVFGPLVRLSALACLGMTALDRFIDLLFVRGTKASYVLVTRIARLDVAVDSAFIGAAEGGARLVEAFTALDRGIDLSVEQTAQSSASLIRGAERADRAVDQGFDLMARGAARTISTITSLDRGVDRTWEEAAAQSARVVQAATAADQAMDRAYTAAAELGKEAVEMVDGGRAERGPRSEPGGGKGVAGPQVQDGGRPTSRQLWTLMNLNVATLLMAGLIGLMLLVFLLWR
jgi:hypothetical protein